MDNTKFHPILMTEDYWADSQLSVVRHYGQCHFNGYDYIIVDKRGIDIFTLSMIAEKEGREMAIEPGEPADLLRKDFLQLYKKLGRDKFLEALKECKDKDDKVVKEYMTSKLKENEE